MLNVSRNHLLAFNSLGVSYLLLISLYPLVANLLDVGNGVCRNPNLGFATKARVCKVAGQEGSLGVMPDAPGSARKCEGIDPHIPKGTPTLGIGVSMDSQMFRKRL
jgi:hypothetical protein